MTHNEVYVLRRVTRDSLNTSGLGCRAYEVRQHSTSRLSLLVAVFFVLVFGVQPDSSFLALRLVLIIRYQFRASPATGLL